MKRLSLLSSRISLALSLMFLLSMSCINVFGQAGTSTVRGTVTDPQGSVVSGATVTLINIGTNTSRTTTTNDVGTYSFEFVPPGDYRVEVQATGFKKAVAGGVHALVSQPTAADVKLEIGNVSETVNVSIAAADQLINRDDATLGNTFAPKQITELPTSGRSIPALLTLQPATTRDGYVAGSRADQSNVTLDGVDVNETQTNSVGANVQDDPIASNLPNNNTVLRLNSEAIQEFRVTTTNPNANQGHSGGAQISLVTRSGSNDWHGSAFELYRSKGLAANDFFNNRSGVAKPQLIRHSFGGSVGGPIVKDRAFFFYSYEALRQLQQASVVRTVPLPSMGLGQLRYCNASPCTSATITTLSTAQLNTAFPAVGMNPAAIAVFAQAAAKYKANDFTTGDSTASALLNTAGFRFNAATPVQLNSHVGKFDFNLTKKQQLFARVNIIYDLTGQAPQFPDTPAPSVWSHPTGFAAGHTWTINNRLVNRFTYGYTREAFSQQGDSGANSISFRFVFSPLGFTRGVTRITPVQTIADDVSWVKGNHTLQFGGNIRIVRNNRIGFSNAFDNAIANPSFYSGGAGNSLSTPIRNFAAANGLPAVSGSLSGIQNAVSALIGRFSQYTANFTFGATGTLLNAGTPTDRTFATEEYEPYVQDIWKFRSNLTFTLGLRYSLSRPVYETGGFELKSNIPLSDLFAQRVAGAAAGTPVNTLITFDRSGPANNRAPLYNWDKNNFQPRVAVAWSPAFRHGLLAKVFGTNSQSQFRGGFAITNDQYGSALAVNFDLANAVGFVSNFTTSANTFCTSGVSCTVAPLFTGFGQAVRPLPRVVVPGNLTFPSRQPADNSRRIETTLDSKLVAPINYSWNFTYERQLPKGFFLQASYIGRYANNLIASRDVMALNNLVDPRSGTDWYTAATRLEILRTQGVSVNNVAQIPYFANLFPTNLAALINANYCGGTCIPLTTNGQPTTQTQAVYYMAAADFFGNDWTDTQDGLDAAVGGNLFFHPQYGALATYSSVAHSRYNAGTISIRQRLGRSLTMDFNYTLSHSLDDASGLQTGGGYGGLFILNPIRQHDNYANSDFDVRHLINANAIWELPFGRGRHFLTHANKLADAAVGGWRMSGIFRWNSGFPISTPFDDARWATNWNVQSDTVRLTSLQSCPDRGGINAPKLFGCNPTGIYRSLRNARPGETGDRNVFRLPGYVSLDMGIAKKFNLPWSEKQSLEIRIEAFNVTNTQRLGPLTGGRTGYGVGLDPAGSPVGCSGAACALSPQDGLLATPLSPPTIWSNFSGIQGKPREMQFGAIFRF